MDNYPAGAANDPIVEWVSYDPKTGLLFWKKTIDGRGANKVKVGDIVGCKNSKGYLQFCFKGRRLKNHRVAWFLHYGYWPINEIDHINGIKDDNRIDNLRDVDGSLNCKNKKVHRDGKPVGITFIKESNTWVAQIKIIQNGKRKTIRSKRYNNQNDAVLEYDRMKNV